MTSHKQIEQSLKRPDSFQDTILTALDFVKKNQLKVVLLVAPVVLVAAMGYGFYVYQQGAASSRRAALAKIQAMQTGEQQATGKQREVIQKSIDALRLTPPNIDASTPPGQNPAAKAVDKNVKLTAENLIKISELEKNLADVKPDYSGSAAAFKTFYDSNKKSAEGWMAGVSWASHQLSLGKAADVRPILEDITKESAKNKFYQIQSRLMLANVLEELGDFDQAIKEADVLSGLVEDDAKAMVLLLKGRLFYFKKDHQNARTVLSELLDKHGSTREAQSARALLAEIGPA
ncbi:MAG: tetratricopeptide repeat protein [Proteobacteria bacterium]|nr:tetratricopeptide repeat protein [Pseudomonadota bacterium]